MSTKAGFAPALYLACLAVASAAAAAADGQTVRYIHTFAPKGTADAVIVQGHALAYTRQIMPLNRAGKLVGEGDVDRQIEQVLTNLAAVLKAAGSGLDKLLRLHVYADCAATADRVRIRLHQRLAGRPGPAMTAVVTPLPEPKAKVAVDAIAVADYTGSKVSLIRCQAIAGRDGFADVALMPRGGVVYLSGKPARKPLAKAVNKSLDKLFNIMDQLKLTRPQIVEMKAFINPVSAADVALAEIKKRFSGQLVPPISFVEWLAPLPIETEMVLYLPLTGPEPVEPLTFYVPAGIKPNPRYSHVAILRADRQVFISGISPRQPADAEAQVRDFFNQLKTVLAATGSDLRHLAKATYYITDNAAGKALGKLRPEYYDPQRPPAASMAKVHGLAVLDRMLTVDMIAVPVRE